MGAGVSLLFAGTYPEKVEKLVLIEGLGPVTAEPEHCAKNLRRSIEADKKFKQKAAEAQGNTSKIYPSFADAVEARIKSVSTYPGSQSLSYEAAKALVARWGFALFSHYFRMCNMSRCQPCTNSTRGHVCR